ncbi:MAG: ribosome maturation factor RimP [Actinomyces sp.]|nr:ribosome maturation factor RimP [Actinomyces sp.]MCI1641216.1 ribosome maturation factor RimP [Actinomyces sp.]MCI1662525.1 ribosome maturation factor RimP [Actinomyces sp.]MCI1692006.1 ribosome maturation factor RimP [Actinomyces sp.]MCI1786837.1 ribosome maturation factor RimP [Actinomyces sp.]MCI1829021.1 ribosome maturation factor RimP [Actinomyces sp.]
MAAHESADLRGLLEGVVAETGLVLESVRELQRGGTPVVMVVVDAADGVRGVDSDTLAEVSRAVSKEMDRADPIDGEYVLEVSTPGAERELTETRHWRREIGRVIRVRLRDRSEVTGRLVAAGEESATLDVDGEAVTISYAQVKKARPRVEFGSEE